MHKTPEELIQYMHDKEKKSAKKIIPCLLPDFHAYDINCMENYYKKNLSDKLVNANKNK